MRYHALTTNLPTSLHLNLKHRLTGVGATLATAKRISDAVQLCAGQPYHLIVLALPSLDNCDELSVALRRVSFAPLIILVDVYDANLAFSALENGADLCLPSDSPVNFLSGHIMAQFRRYTAYNKFENPRERETIPIQSGDLYIDPTRRIVRVRDKEVSLRPREFSLLWYFVQNPGDVLTAEQICEHAWGMEGSYNRGIAQPIRLLRQAIEPDPEHPIYIETVRRVGYRFTAYKRIL